MRIPLLVFAVSVVVGCPAPEAVTSVDGLEGGKLTSGIEAPEVTTTAATIETLSSTAATTTSLTTTTLDAQTSSLGAAEATSIETATLTVTGSADVADLAADVMTADSITAVSVTTDQLVAGSLHLRPTGGLDDGSLIGNVVGVTPALGSGYDGLDRDCFNAFAGSHLCGEVDVLHFLRSANFSTQVQALTAAALDGATFATVTHAVVGFDGANAPIVADDCESWQGIKNAGEPPGLHARHVLDIEPAGGTTFLGRVSTSNSCAVDDLRVLCCGE